MLDATVGLLEQSYMVTVTDIAARTGLDPAQVAKSLEALDPVYVDFRKTTTGGDPRFWYVFKVTPEARRAVGQWPTAESLVSALAEQLYAASHQETGDERQSLLAYAARLIGDTLRDLAIQAAAQVLSPALGEVVLPAPEPLPAPAVAVAKPATDGEPAVAAVVPGEVATPPAAVTGPEPATSAAESAAHKPDVASPEAAERTRHQAEVAGPKAAEPAGHQPEAAGPGAARPDVRWSPPPWPDPPAAAPAEGPPGSPGLAPLPEPAAFPPSLAGRRATAHRSVAARPSGAAAVTDTDAADTDQNPAQAPGDTANAS